MYIVQTFKKILNKHIFNYIKSIYYKYFKFRINIKHADLIKTLASILTIYNTNLQ